MTHGLLALAALFPLAQPVMVFVCHMAATVLLCRLHMVWTHVVVSPPSPLPWYKRTVRGRYVFKCLALPSLKVAVAHQLVLLLPAITFFAWGPIPEGAALRNDLVLRGLAVVATALMVAFFVLLPATVHLTRVEASLLSEDVDTVVAFDRTLGGRVAADTKWSIRYLAVMASFASGDRYRIAKYYIKATGMLMLIIVSAVVCMSIQVNTFGIDRIHATLQDLAQQIQGPSQVTPNM